MAWTSDSAAAVVTTRISARLFGSPHDRNMARGVSTLRGQVQFCQNCDGKPDGKRAFIVSCVQAAPRMFRSFSHGSRFPASSLARA